MINFSTRGVREVSTFSGEQLCLHCFPGSLQQGTYIYPPNLITDRFAIINCLWEFLLFWTIYTISAYFQARSLFPSCLYSPFSRPTRPLSLSWSCFATVKLQKKKNSFFFSVVASFVQVQTLSVPAWEIQPQPPRVLRQNDQRISRCRFFQRFVIPHGRKFLIIHGK